MTRLTPSFSDKEKQGLAQPGSLSGRLRADGTVRAHGANAKKIGKNLIEPKDVDGKAFVKERVDMAKTNAPCLWQDYKSHQSGRTRKSSPSPCTVANAWMTVSFAVASTK